MELLTPYIRTRRNKDEISPGVVDKPLAMRTLGSAGGNFYNRS